MKPSDERFLRRGRESARHREIKARVVESLKAKGFLCYPEYRRADVAAFHPATGRWLACEVELRPRHVIPNLRRNEQSGFQGHLIVTPDVRVRRAVLRHLERKLPESSSIFLGAITASEIDSFHSTQP